MKRCVIVGGAEIKNYDFIRKYLNQNDFYIFCDCGLNHLENLGVKADLIIGDFDSHEKPKNFENVIVLPTVKDDTDTIYAIKEGIKKGFQDFLLIGVIGARLDHTLVNVYGLLMLANANKNAKIIDDYSEMELILPGEIKTVTEDFKYFSLVNISGNAKGISISGAKYNLENFNINPEYQFATSNEVLPGEIAKIKIHEGNLLLIRVK